MSLIPAWIANQKKYDTESGNHGHWLYYVRRSLVALPCFSFRRFQKNFCLNKGKKKFYKHAGFIGVPLRAEIRRSYTRQAPVTMLIKAER